MKRRDALIDKHGRDIERPAPLPAVQIPVLDHAQAFLGGDHPFVFAVRRGRQIAVALDQAAQQFLLVRKHAHRGIDVHPLGDALIGLVGEVEPIGHRVVEILVAHDPGERAVGIALVALREEKLHAGDAVDAALQEAPRINALELVGVEHVANRLRRDLGALLALRRARQRLRIGAATRDETDNSIDLARDPVPGHRRLMPPPQDRELVGGVLRAVVIVPRLLLLGDLVYLGL